mgnify:CR=1 FL=1
MLTYMQTQLMVLEDSTLLIIVTLLLTEMEQYTSRLVSKIEELIVMVIGTLRVMEFQNQITELTLRVLVVLALTQLRLYHLDRRAQF